MAHGDPGGTKYAGTQTASTTGVMAPSESFFEPLVAGDQKASLASLSPKLLLFTTYLEGSLAWGPSLFIVPCVRHIKGGPWLESYSVDQHVRHLKGHPGWGPPL